LNARTHIMTVTFSGSYIVVDNK